MNAIEKFYYRLRNFNFKYDFLYNKLYKKMLSCPMFVQFDAWNLNSNLTDYIILRLLWMVQHSNGCPVIGEFEDKVAVNEGYKNGYDKWIETLWEICKGLACHRLMDSNWYFNKIKKHECDLQYYREFNNALHERHQKALELLVKYYYNLWD